MKKHPLKVALGGLNLRRLKRVVDWLTIFQTLYLLPLIYIGYWSEIGLLVENSGGLSVLGASTPQLFKLCCGVFMNNPHAVWADFLFAGAFAGGRDFGVWPMADRGESAGHPGTQAGLAMAAAARGSHSRWPVSPVGLG